MVNMKKSGPPGLWITRTMRHIPVLSRVYPKESRCSATTHPGRRFFIPEGLGTVRPGC